MRKLRHRIIGQSSKVAQLFLASMGFGCPKPKWSSFFAIFDGCRLHHSRFLSNSGLGTCRFCPGTSMLPQNTLTEKQFHRQVFSPLAKTIIPDSRLAD